MFTLESANEYLSYMRSMRRELHRIPEIGYCEHATGKLIAEELTALGADEVVRLAGTGVKAVFYGRDRERAVAFRAELDGLKISEANDHDYVSRNEGYMHACGHDGHMAMLLGLAKRLGEHKSRLEKSVVLLFQPGEEDTGGAERMAAEGALSYPEVEAVYGMHMMPQVPFGTLAVQPGPLMARSVEFSIDLIGKSAHGATPHLGIDAIAAAAEFIQSCQSIISRKCDLIHRPVLTFGKIEGGSSINIIAEKVTVQGIIRGFEDEVCDLIRSQLIARLEALKQTHGIDYVFTPLVDYPAVVNDAALAAEASEALADLAVQTRPVMMAEDFSYYQREVPGLLMFLGLGQEEPLHSTHFDFDERILAYGLYADWKLIEKGIIR
jgi:amidohydrolase